MSDEKNPLFKIYKNILNLLLIYLYYNVFIII